MANTFRIDVEIVTRLLRLCWPFFRSVELTFYGQVAFCFIYISCVVFYFPFPLGKTISHFTFPINVNLNVPTL